MLWNTDYTAVRIRHPKELHSEFFQASPIDIVCQKGAIPNTDLTFPKGPGISFGGSGALNLNRPLRRALGSLRSLGES